MKYAHQIIDTLTSPAMHGRGYVNKGDKIAARYIESEFTKIHLQPPPPPPPPPPINDDYFQKFKFPVNIFPKKMEVSIDDVQLKPGADFIVDANSSKAKGTYELDWLVSANYRGSLDKIKNRFIVVDKSRISNKDEKQAMDLWVNDPHEAKGVVVIEEKKLTWTVARKKYKYPVIHILKSSISPDSEKYFFKD